MSPALVTGPALLLSHPLLKNLCEGPALDTIQSWICFMGISSS